MSADAAFILLRRVKPALPYLIVLVAGGFLYYTAENFEYEQVTGRIGPAAWPQMILVLMLATALWGAVANMLRADQSSAEVSNEAAQDEALIRPPEIYPWLVWLAVAATLVYLLLLPVLGFFLATIIYTFVLMYLGHYRRVLRASLLSVAVAFAFMFIFMRVVYVALPLGTPPFDELSYALMAAMGVH